MEKYQKRAWKAVRDDVLFIGLVTSQATRARLEKSSAQAQLVS